LLDSDAGVSRILNCVTKFLVVFPQRDCFIYSSCTLKERFAKEKSMTAFQGDTAGPKITPIPLAEMDERTRDLIARAGLDRDGEPLRVFGTIARHPKLFSAWLRFASRLMTGGSFDRRLTELVILRVAYNMGNDYEWGQHVELSAGFGVDAATIARIIEGPSASGWSPLEALLLQATDELHNKRRITSSTWDELARQLNEIQLIELCFLVGQYEMLAMFLQTVDVRLEPGKEGLPHHDNI
jgi:alkylhydroperoxidase family enzyme